MGYWLVCFGNGDTASQNQQEQPTGPPFQPNPPGHRHQASQGWAGVPYIGAGSGTARPPLIGDPGHPLSASLRFPSEALLRLSSQPTLSVVATDARSSEDVGPSPSCGLCQGCYISLRRARSARPWLYTPGPNGMHSLGLVGPVTRNGPIVAHIGSRGMPRAKSLNETNFSSFSCARAHSHFHFHGFIVRRSSLGLPA